MKSYNLAFYLAHLASVAGAAAAAPEITPAAASPLAEGATKTRTKVWSATESSVTFNQWINPYKATMYTTKAVTSFEPRPTFASYPGTVIQTVVSRVRLEDRYTYSDGRTTTSTTSYVVTVPETWVVSKPTAAAGKPLTGLGNLSCEENKKDRPTCRSSTQNENDPLCQAAGLKTGCQGQCVRHEEDDEWWCYMMHQRDYVHPEMRMGRACWGAGLRYRQLNVPCLEGDLGMGCVACEGLDYTWGAVNWEGPEASD